MPEIRWITGKTITIQSRVFKVDDEFAKVMGIHLTEGRWFNRDDYSPDVENHYYRSKVTVSVVWEGTGYREKIQ